ncbi:multidrug ABC transporter ATP-binding protein, partial [Bacillus atrophaeus]|nr:multidrug ABC transporter ATP-binding protein [Bacillus atrophaeus]
MGVIKRYMHFVKPYKKQIVITVLIGIVKFSIPLALPLLLKYVVDDIIQGGGSAHDKTTSLVTIMAVMFAIFLVLR